MVKGTRRGLEKTNMLVIQQVLVLVYAQWLFIQSKVCLSVRLESEDIRVNVVYSI